MISADPILTGRQLDSLGHALLGLARELWIVKDRQLVMESLLQERGLLADLDSYQPSPALSAGLQAERERMMAGILTTLLSSGDGPSRRTSGDDTVGT